MTAADFLNLVRELRTLQVRLGFKGTPPDARAKLLGECEFLERKVDEVVKRGLTAQVQKEGMFR